MTITFVVAGDSRLPSGSRKNILEYANYLSFRNHAVRVVHAAQPDRSASAIRRAYEAAQYTLRNATSEFGPEMWFRVWPSVKLLWVPSLEEKHIPPADVIVATDTATAEAIATYGPTRGCKFFLIQNYEPSAGTEDRIRAAWKLPLQKIVSARWLKEVAEGFGESAAYIPNGLDFDAFGCDVPIRERTAPRVSMMYSESVTKGSQDGIKALRIVKKVLPDLKAKLFGVGAAPKEMSREWMSYSRPAPSQLRTFYNQTTVFLAPSWQEGWPLPPAEAMCCGTALVCTDIPGHQEYAVHERNAYMANPVDPNSLAEGLLRVLREKTLRFPLAEQALSDLRRFSWEESTLRVEKEFVWRVADRMIEY